LGWCVDTPPPMMNFGKGKSTAVGWIASQRIDRNQSSRRLTGDMVEAILDSPRAGRVRLSGRRRISYA
jgi:hypothetical protein